MTILHFTYSTRGGAGVVAGSLNQALRSRGIESRIVWRSNGSLISTVENRAPVFLAAGFDRFVVNKRSDRYASVFRSQTGIPIDVSQKDIVHLHWTPGLVSLSQLEVLGRRKLPTVITLHDMFFLTGGCHHSGDCQKFRKDCADCPLVRAPFRKNIRAQFDSKLEIFGNWDNVVFVAPNEWMLSTARASRLGKLASVVKIHNPIDEAFLAPINKLSQTRDICLVATNLQDPNKEVESVVAAVKALNTSPGQRVKLKLVGSNPKGSWLSVPGVEHSGAVPEARSLVDVYDSCRTLIIASRNETAPLVALEASCRGLNIIARANIGLPDEVLESGRITRFSNNLELVGAIKETYESPVPDGKSFQSKYLNQSPVDEYLRLYNAIV